MARLAQQAQQVRLQTCLVRQVPQVQQELQAQQAHRVKPQLCLAQQAPQVLRVQQAQQVPQAHKESKAPQVLLAHRVLLVQMAALRACSIFQQTRLRRRATLALAIFVGTTPLRSTLLRF